MLWISVESLLVFSFWLLISPRSASPPPRVFSIGFPFVTFRISSRGELWNMTQSRSAFLILYTYYLKRTISGGILYCRYSEKQHDCKYRATNYNIVSIGDKDQKMEDKLIRNSNFVPVTGQGNHKVQSGTQQPTPRRVVEHDNLGH